MPVVDEDVRHTPFGDDGLGRGLERRLVGDACDEDAHAVPCAGEEALHLGLIDGAAGVEATFAPSDTRWLVKARPSWPSPPVTTHTRSFKLKRSPIASA